MKGKVRVDVVVLTAIRPEYAAVRRHLVDLEESSHRGTLFEIGTLRGSACRVALAITGEGNQTAATLTERANAHFSPKSMLFVGVAGALREEVALGDVVIATWVYNYHSGIQTPEGFQPRTRSWEGAHQLLQVALHLDRTGSWTALLPEQHPRSLPVIHFAPVVAGEVLQDGAVDALRALYDDAVAVNMEDSGMLRADHLSGARMALAVRGISDRADGAKKDADSAGWQQTAATNASAFAMALVASFYRVLEDAETRERWAKRVTRRRLVMAAVVLLILFGAVVSYTIRLGLEQFYQVLGADAGELSIGVLEMVGPLLFVMAVGLAVTAIGLAALVAGASLLPWSEPTRAAMPATALAAMLFLTALGSLVFVPDSWGRELATMVLGMVFLGLAGRPSKQKARHTLGGVGIGIVILILLLMLAGATNRWLPGPWPLVLFYASVAAAIASLGLWTRVEGQRRRRAEEQTPAEPGETTPMALVKRVWTEIMPSIRDFRKANPLWRARRIVVGYLVGLTLLITVVLWGVVTWLDGRADAGRAALQLGYVPVEHDSLALPTPVRPATITLKRPTDDPLAVCRRSPDRAASLLASNGDSYWVLLRPIGDTTAPATVIRLPLANYLVRLVPDRNLPNDGEPWVRSACDG